MTNSKSTKRALVSSALAVFLCVAMLIGTTFAWFTDTASTSVNKIQAGTLDVALEMYENGEWVSAEGKTLDFVKAEGHESEAILWEPGCTYNLPELRIVNNGNLALKYKVVITGINGDAKLNEVIDWTIGTVAQGTEQKLAAGEKTDAFTISGTMKTTAGNAYQGLSIDGISITVLATQDTVEYDSTTNEYDKKAKYSTADAKLTKKLISGGSLTINETLSINSDETKGNSDVIRVTGGNHVITGGEYIANGGKSNSALRVDGGTVTIKGGVFTVNGSSNAIYGAGGNITIEGGTFKSTDAYEGTFYTLNCQDYSGSVITVKGGAFYKFDPSNCNVAPAGMTEVVVADGYKVVQSGDWYYVIPNEAVAVSSANALTTALTEGAKIALVSDINITEYVTVNCVGTVDIVLNGHKIVRDGDNTTGIYVNNSSAVLNIIGEGNVTAGSAAVFVNAGTVNIYGGTYTGLQAVYTMGTGVANIYGGTFKTENTGEYGSKFILNQQDGSRDTSSIKVYGGEFVNFNPADNAAEGEHTNFLANGYNVVTTNSGNDTIYTVVATN